VREETGDKRENETTPLLREENKLLRQSIEANTAVIKRLLAVNRVLIFEVLLARLDHHRPSEAPWNPAILVAQPHHLLRWSSVKTIWTKMATAPAA